jgi:uncharacterized protein
LSVEVNVVGMRCGAPAGGLSCTYCYQGAVRVQSKNEAPDRVDHAAVQRAVLAAAGPAGFSVFGGEPLLASLEDLEKLWAFGLEKYGKNGVQTSGRPITEAHIALFKRYSVHVGFSIDGPGELNDARRAGSNTQTREATAWSIAMLRRCLREGIGASLIVTLHRLNARPDRLPALLEWFRDLDAAGLQSARLHLLELDGPGKALALTADENVAAMAAAQDLERTLKTLRFDVFADVLAKLRDPDASATCVWNDCDPWTTPAVHGITASGGRGLCQRVHKDGKQYLPADTQSRVRQVVLWNTPQAEGGCSGCRFFLQCGGQCPGTAIAGDWRKRSVDCPTWYNVLERVEAEMLQRGERPASLAPDLDARVARRLAAYVAGPDAAHGDSHGDSHCDHHGDHEDHGDHTDLARVVSALAGGEEVPYDVA